MPPHGQRECAEVIEVRVRDENGVHLPTVKRGEIRRRLFPVFLRMHAGIEDKAAAFDFEKIRVRADLGVAREVDEFQSQATGGGIARTAAACGKGRFPRAKNEAASNSHTTPSGRKPGSQSPHALISASASRQ